MLYTPSPSENISHSCDRLLWSKQVLVYFCDSVGVKYGCKVGFAVILAVQVWKQSCPKTLAPNRRNRFKIIHKNLNRYFKSPLLHPNKIELRINNFDIVENLLHIKRLESRLFLEFGD